MIATLSLMSCVLVTAQPADRSDWLLLPQLGRAQEFVYRGTYEEKAAGSDLEFERKYSLRGVVFVLDASPRGAETAFLTVLRPRNAAGGHIEEAAPSSARLEIVRVDPRGRVSADPWKALTVPLEGPPTVEVGAFVEVPREPVGQGKSWSVEEVGRPARKWTVAGTEAVNGTTCIKLVGVQQSDDWEKPRADRVAWWRQDTVWVAPRLGVAHKVERLIKRREPARKQPFYQSVLAYELETRSEYPRNVYDDIRREVTQTRDLGEAAAPLLPEPAKYSAQIDALLGRIKYHTDHHAVAVSVYREPLLHLQRRLEAARRGEAAPAVAPMERESPSIVVAVGKPVPDFLTTDFTSKETGRLYRFRGRPLLLIFYNPTSPLTENVLRLGEEISISSKGAVGVVGLAMSQDAESVRKQRAELKLTIPVFDGRGLRQTYAVEATPKMMVIDPDGVLRGAWMGWGEETRDAVLRELRQWQKK
jgi:peroxiredoxin